MHFKYIFFGYADYMKVANNEILNDENVLYYAPIDFFKFKSIIYRLVSYAVKYNLDNLIPLFSYRYLYNLERNGSLDSTFFILYEQNICSTKTNFLKYVKKKFPNSRIIFIFTNTLASGVNIKQLDYVKTHRNLFDLVMTFNEIDAVEHGFVFYDQVYSSIDIANNQEEKSDICFCGLDKGRKKIIEEIQQRLERYGLTCDFNVADSDHRISHTCVLAKTVKTDCILEVLMNTSQPGSSLRVAEAIANKKKLLTNNPFIKDKEYFTPNQISYFSTPEDIDVEFIKRKLDDSLLIDPYLVSPRRFLQFLKDSFV